MKRILILAACVLAVGASACSQQANQPAPANTPAPATNEAAPQPQPDTPAGKALTYELKIEGMT